MVFGHHCCNLRADAASLPAVFYSYQAVGLDNRLCDQVLVERNDGPQVDNLEADAFFVELELVPQSGIVADLVARDEGEHIMVDARNKTSTEGIFAAGDVTDVISEQVLISVGEGAKAALAAYEYLLQVDG